jgi:hypothetical protein
LISTIIKIFLLAHAFYPTRSEVHFDDQEKW